MTTPLGIEPTLSPQQVAELTGLHYQSVLAEVKCGALRARKIRGRYLITRAAYEAWLEPPDESPTQSTRAPLSVPDVVLPKYVGAAGTVARLRALEGAR